MAGALTGYRIVDITQVISGPLATRILADQGADVLKIEPPTGDILRHMGGISGLSPTFTTINRSKRSIVLDLKQAAALDTLKRLVRGADVFIQNSRPGAADAMGLSEAAIREIRPDIVYVSISGFGETGPFAHKRVYDPMIQGMSTLAEIQGGPGGRPRLMRVIIPDKVTALTASQAITAALLARERTGEGQHVRLSMLDAVLAFAWPEGMAYHTFVADHLQKPKQVARRDLIYETSDGYVVVSTVAHREWEAFCRAAEKTEWLSDPRFADTAGLVKNAKERLDLMASAIRERSTEHWLEVLDREDVPCAPVLMREDVHLHPQVVANEIVVEDEHPVAGKVRQTRPAERMDGTPSEISRPAPTLGQHTDEILAESGLEESEITALREAGALGRSA
ncbi:MAG: CoA transferase [Myxococcota bacterium]|jgi:crotonobetainyl-CoA:carnitine CoA-transferase CaiB-like acyl-CoA transferase|nr:CoA transferase [Myxococcota bacterium]